MKLIQNKKKGGEKAFRYSLRKFKFGAASVLVGLSFLGSDISTVSAHFETVDNVTYLGDTPREVGYAKQSVQVRTEISKNGKHVKYTILFNKNYEYWARPGLTAWLPTGLDHRTVRIRTYNSDGKTGGGGLPWKLVHDLGVHEFPGATRELVFNPDFDPRNEGKWNEFWEKIGKVGSGSDIPTEWKEKNQLLFGINSWENVSHNAYKWEIEADVQDGVVASQLPVVAGIVQPRSRYPRYVAVGPNETVDTDGDGLTDKQEVDKGTDPLKQDTDGDGLTDKQEIDKGTDPLKQDTDGDGLTDKQEIDKGTDPLKQDTDGDGLTDKQEVDKGTDPLKPATDGDGFPDVVEEDAGSDPNDKNSTPDNVDTDGDGFPDKVEKAEGTDPNDPKSNPDTKDTDGDGFPDKVEKAEGTDPNDPQSNPDTKDTDGDGFPDVVEKDAGSDPNDKNSTPDNVDTDKDGFPDVVEKDAGSDPNDKNSTPDNVDTDKDGFPDKVEKAEGTDPNDPQSNPDTKDTDGDGFP
ncbi:YSIRK-type signal peptide-containing protein, partial [Streptococcus pseudopneumoniae]|uniref:YSIRK-type signal peptide-containing protein n=1 Tax=Streptococcus pseudopneumoniae TaxID=257758 RepID=UPI001419A83C